MLLSIITVSRWNDQALKRTLESVDTCLSTLVDQNMFEQIVVLSEESDLQNEAFRRYLYIPPKGIYNAMNCGLKEANGKWVWFLNAGDECAPDILKIISELEESDSGVLSAGVWVASKPGGALTERFGNFTSPHQGTFYKTEVLQKNGGYREDFKTLSDRVAFDEIRSGSKIQRSKNLAAIFYEDGLSCSKDGFLLRLKESFKYYKEKPWDMLRSYRLVRDIIFYTEKRFSGTRKKDSGGA